MQKWLRSIDWTAIVGSALALAFGMLVIIPASELPPQKSSSYSSEPSDNYPWWDHASFWEAFFTGLLFIYTAKLCSATKTLIGEEREESSRELRAYVLTEASDIRISPPAPPMLGVLAQGFRPYACIRIRNFGKTPAYDLRTFGNVAIVAWPIDPEELPPLDEGVPSSSDFLGPNDSRVPEYRGDFGLVLTEWDVLLLEEGSLAIVVYGKVHYRDAFDVRWTTNFRKFAGGPHGLRPTSNGAGNLLGAHSEGNCETKNDW